MNSRVFKRKLAGTSALALVVPNSLLSAVFFLMAVGTAKYFFVEWEIPDLAVVVMLAAAILLGLAFTGGEATMNFESVDTGTAKKLFFGLVMLAVINVAGGVYRSVDYAREKQNLAKLDAANDPRVKGYEDSKKALQDGVLNDRKLDNDAQAMSAIDVYNEKIADVVKEYALDAHLNDDSMLWTILVSVLLVGVNVIFSFSCSTWYREKKYLEKQEENQRRQTALLNSQLENEYLQAMIQNARLKGATAHINPQSTTPTPPKQPEPVVVAPETLNGHGGDSGKKFFGRLRNPFGKN